MSPRSPAHQPVLRGGIVVWATEPLDPQTAEEPLLSRDQSVITLRQTRRCQHPSYQEHEDQEQEPVQLHGQAASRQPEDAGTKARYYQWRGAALR